MQISFARVEELEITPKTDSDFDLNWKQSWRHHNESGRKSKSCSFPNAVGRITEDFTNKTDNPYDKT